jgi:hypothetical protein
MICDEITAIIRPQISVMQHGSTVTNLVEFSNFVNGHQVDEVYTDFSKAFDQVNHGLLSFNLKSSGDAVCLILVLFDGPHSTRQD